MVAIWRRRKSVREVERVFILSYIGREYLPLPVVFLPSPIYSLSVACSSCFGSMRGEVWRRYVVKVGGDSRKDLRNETGGKVRLAKVNRKVR